MYPRTRKNGGAGAKLALCATLVVLAAAPFIVVNAAPSSAAAGDGFAFILADQQTAATYQPGNSVNSAGGTNSVMRTGTGTYVVRRHNLVNRGVVHVTAVGSSASCKPVSWGYVFNGQRVEVHCYGPAGSLTDSQFALTFTSARIAGNIGAYLLGDSPTVPATFPPSSTTRRAARTRSLEPASVTTPHHCPASASETARSR